MSFHFLSSTDETHYKEAATLAKRVFITPDATNAETDRKYLLWDDLYIKSLSRVFLMRSNAETVGLVRATIRPMKFPTGTFRGACLSSICILEKYRGKGASRELMHFTHEKLSEAGVEIAYLVARKAADHYYTKFDYFGLAAYGRLELREMNNNLNRNSAKVELSAVTYHEKLISLLESSFEATYGKTPGCSERTSEFWRFTFQRFQNPPEGTFLIHSDKIPVGYFIRNGSQIMECAWIPEFHGAELYDTFLQQAYDIGIRIIKIPGEHPLLREKSMHDLEWTVRSCPFGGHMLKVLPSVQTQKYALSTVEGVEHLLGLSSALGPSENRARWHLSFPDEL